MSAQQLPEPFADLAPYLAWVLPSYAGFMCEEGNCLAR